ncbi:MAG: haloacid dehalogenase-like hydrolase [Actinomycetia bacterium]|nr:haloacid dehalogenase-like hydrolase [Actinomycetes bacterium]
MTGLLPSWRQGATREAIVDFLDQVDEIPPSERVAVFDNDGTMWCEKPNYTQLDFLVLELSQAVARDPRLAERAEYRAVLDRDMEAVQAMGLEGVATALLDLFAGLTPEQFDTKVAAFFANQVHPDRGGSYRQQRYQPMLELMDELRARGFDFYIVTGGGAEFVRVISQDFYAVPPEGVVGSQIDYDLSRDDGGQLRLLRTNHLVTSGPNEGPAKVPNIRRILGRRPIVAGGNSAGDAEMLEYATTYDGPSLALLVDHDDGEREYAYTSKAGTFETEETILQTASRLGWTVASIKEDWSAVFAD